MVSRSLGQVEAYLTVREILAEASKGVPPKAGLWREFSGFGRFRFATLGFSLGRAVQFEKSETVLRTPTIRAGSQFRNSKSTICSPPLTTNDSETI